MTAAGLSDLVVEVLHYRAADKHPKWSVGSGFFVGSRLVLTALHNVDGPGELLVRVHGTEERPAVVCLQGNEDLVDLAVLEVSDVAVDVPPLRYGAVDRSASAIVERCWAVGFPRFKERAHDPKPLRLSAQVDGEIPTGENLDQLLLTLRVRNSPRPLPSGSVRESEWEGISGATVFSGNDIIVGVITEHSPSEGESALTIVPITALDLLPQAEATKWWKLLGVDRQALVGLPVPAALVSGPWLPTLAPRQPFLPPLISTFFTRNEYIQGIAGNCIGREQDFAKLCADLADPQVHLIVIEGFGGIGKTTLAARFANYAHRSYQVLWIDCRGIAVTAERFLLEVGLLASGQYKFPWLQAIVENPALSRVEKISGLIDFLSSISKLGPQQRTEQPLLPLAFFFDDYHLVTDPELVQIIDKITESQLDVKVVLITRTLSKALQSTVDMNNAVLLDGLSLADCQKFIGSYVIRFPALAQVDEETLKRIWILTGFGVPTALKILVSMTRTRALQDVLQQLPNYDPMTAAASEWFGSLFAELSFDEQLVTTEASIFRRAIPRNILRCVSRSPHVEEVMDNLVDRFILIFDGQQYSMHVLWSEYSKLTLNSTERQELHSRAARCYRDIAPVERYAMVMSRVESCHHFVEAANLEEAVEVILPVADTLRFWGIYLELFEILHEVEELAKRINVPFDPQLRIQQSAALHALGKVEQAIATLRELIEANKGEIEISALQELGWIYVEAGDRREAEKLLLRSLKLARQYKYPKLESEALYKLQYNAYHESKFEEVLKYNKDRLTILQGIKDEPGVHEAIAWIYHDIGNVYREQGRYDDALKLYLQSLDTWRGVGESPFHIGWLNYDIGQIYRDQAQYKEALQRLETALNLFNKVKYLYGIAHVKTELGRVGSRLEMSSQSIDQVEEAISIFRQLKAPGGEAYALNALGQIYLYRSQPEKALVHLQESLDLDTELHNTKGIAKTLHYMGLAFEQQGKDLFERGQSDEALKRFKKSMDMINRSRELLIELKAVINFEGIDDDALRITKFIEGI